MYNITYNDILNCKSLTEKEKYALLKHLGYIKPEVEVYKVSVKPVLLITIDKLY